MEHKQNDGRDIDKKESFTADTAIGYGYGISIDDLRKKASQVHASGKTALCAEILRIFKPLVYDRKNCAKSCVSFNRSLNKTLGAAGAAAGVAFSIANKDAITGNLTGNQFYDALLGIPFVSEAILGYGGYLLARTVHFKSVTTMQEEKIPTLADAVFGEKGVVPSLVTKAESYLKKNNPDYYEQVMEDVEKSAQYFSDKFDYEEKKLDLERRRDEDAVRYRHVNKQGHMMTSEAIKAAVERFDKEQEQLEKERPERQSAIKQLVLRHKNNPHE